MADAPLSRIELDESSGPVSPRFQYSIHVIVDGATATIRHKTPKGVFEATVSLSPERHESLRRELLARLPLGKDVDLVGAMRGRKGVSFNFVAIERGSERARVDYLLTHVEGGEHPDLVIAIEAIKALATEAEASQGPSRAP